MNERQSRIQSIVQSLSHVAGADPSLQERLFDSGILDSFGLPDLVTALELQFRLTIPDSDLLPANFSSIQAIDAYIGRVRKDA